MNLWENVTVEGFCTYKAPTNMKNESTPKRNDNLLPVFRFDLQNRLIFANVSAKPLMDEWKCKVNEKVPAELISRYPEIFHASLSHRPMDLTVEFNNCVIKFSIVPFPEASYIGMYAYAMEASGTYTGTNQPVSTVTEVVEKTV